MNERPFLDGYNGQNTGELIALAQTYRVDSIVLAFESAIQKKLELLGIDALSDVELDVLAVEAMEREVSNGGYHQFFLNSSRRHAQILPQSLSKIGCPKTLEITNEAIRIMGTTDPEAVALDELTDALDEHCDSRNYDTGENIADRLFEFIVKNRDAIDLSSVAISE